MNLEDEIFTLRSAIIKAKKEMKKDHEEDKPESPSRKFVKKTN